MKNMAVIIHLFPVLQDEGGGVAVGTMSSLSNRVIFAQNSPPNVTMVSKGGGGRLHRSHSSA